MGNVYKLSDCVIARIAQIVQEGMLLGVDVVDIMRQIEVTPAFDEETLVLTEEYVHCVAAMHKKLLIEAELLKKKQNGESELRH